MRSLLLLGFSILAQSAIIGEWNDLDRDNYEPTIGRPCAEDDESNQTGGVKFYVDSFREKVYAFYFNGCDGTENVYVDVPTAEKNFPKDSAQCDGFNMTGWPTYAEEGNEKNYICQPGSYYLNYGEFSAICCDNSTAERYRAEVVSVCPNGEEPLTHQVVYKNVDDEIEKEESRRLIGRNCTHRFCPETHSCHQSEFEAFCCPLPPPSEATTTVKSPEIDTPAGLEGSENDFFSLWVVVFGVVVLTSIVSAVVFWRRRSSSRKMPYDQREVAALNP